MSRLHSEHFVDNHTVDWQERHEQVYHLVHSREHLGHLGVSLVLTQYDVLGGSCETVPTDVTRNTDSGNDSVFLGDGTDTVRSIRDLQRKTAELVSRGWDHRAVLCVLLVLADVHSVRETHLQVDVCQLLREVFPGLSCG